jgi:LmbE family N-acetylglucosaminyl deacetylase
VSGRSLIAWPTIASGWHTCLLELNFQTSSLAAPYVSMSAGGLRERQYFPSSDRGKCWLNLSFVRDAIGASDDVAISCSGVSFQTAPCHLRVFRAAPQLSGRILVLAPHPDDAEIAAFGLYNQRNTSIVTITAGNGGVMSYQSQFSNAVGMYRFKGWLRVCDSITVPLLGGVSPANCFNLGYFDGRLATMRRNAPSAVREQFSSNTDIGVYRRYNVSTLLSNAPREATWSNLVDDVRRVIDRVGPDVVVAPHPQLDEHPDHESTAAALASALTLTGTRPNVLLYTNHADGNRFPYGPANSVVSLPHHPREEVRTDQVFSLPLSADLQRLKLFAIEAMHDIRLSPTTQYRLVLATSPRN